jgi:hypothetical protein
MKEVADLLARKQKLLERMQANTGPRELEEIQRNLAEINAALNAIETAGPPIRALDLAGARPAYGAGKVVS